MNPYAMRFAVIRFMPYVQTREFANIGIIITHPKSGYFNFKIEHRYSRLSKFFRHFEPAVYKAVTQAFAEELTRIQQLAATSNPDQIRAMLDHLARPREAVIMAAAAGATIAENPTDELERLFDYYVGHSFAQSQPEAELTRYIQTLVKKVHTEFPFKESVIGDQNGFHATLPLVQESKGKILKIIKPIFLGQRDPADIYHKSDKWISSIKRLRRSGYIEHPQILFAYEPPENPRRHQQNALEDVLSELQNNDFSVVHKDQQQQITQFAAA